ncbi:MAG: hypothetical protein HXX09_05735 [Bacteroidetes bacterium]|nr:hypothetical protein [Bacteroidota bacterium]
MFININSIFSNNKNLEREIEESKILLGKVLVNKFSNINTIREAEFKVFSQWGDDGIIQYLINNLQISNPYFVEFGVENYTEANTRFLLMNDNWSGLIIDGSIENVNYIIKDSIYWKYDLVAKQLFVTAENINNVFYSERVPEKIGLLHIDIDGNDYWIWKAIKNLIADIVIVEYNSLFGYERSITIPYDAEFVRTKTHFSNLFYGTSLLALCDLAQEKGYSFIGCNSAGNNAYFILNEKLGPIKPVSIKEGFVESKFKEARNEQGLLSFIRGDNRIAQIRDLEVYNTRTNKLERF